MSPSNRYRSRAKRPGYSMRTIARHAGRSDGKVPVLDDRDDPPTTPFLRELQLDAAAGVADLGVERAKELAAIDADLARIEARRDLLVEQVDDLGRRIAAADVEAPDDEPSGAMGPVAVARRQRADLQARRATLEVALAQVREDVAGSAAARERALDTFDSAASVHADLLAAAGEEYLKAYLRVASRRWRLWPFVRQTRPAVWPHPPAPVPVPWDRSNGGPR